MQVVGIGGANIDIHGHSAGALVLRDSNPGTLRLTAGGVCRNILENLARLGVQTQLCSTIGDDMFGAFLQADCENLGIGTAFLQKRAGQATSCYLSVIDNTGDMLLAINSMGILKTAGTAFLQAAMPAINNAALCIVDGNLPPAAMEHLVKHTKTPLYYDPVSTAWAKEHLQFLPFFHTVKPNLLEAEILAGMKIEKPEQVKEAAGRILAAGVKEVYISLAENGLYYQNTHGESAHCKAKKLPVIANTTGAGDATMAAIAYGALAGIPGPAHLPFTVAASLVALSHPGTINPNMSKETCHQFQKEYVE